MPHISKWSIPLILVGAMFAHGSVVANVTVVMMRHAEKPAEDLGQLSCQGLNRALKLAPLLASRFGKADTVIAPNPAIKMKKGNADWNYVRPLATIEPYAISMGLPVSTTFGWNQSAAMVNLLLARNHGLVVVAWEHHVLVDIARQMMSRLGGEINIPVWDKNDFDTLFVFNIATSTFAAPKLISFSTQQQGLNGQPTTCPK